MLDRLRVPLNWVGVIRWTVQRTVQDDCLGWAGELAYFFFLALFPALLFFVALDRLLFVLVLRAHDRRRIRHVAVTAHPTAAWTAQQLREAFPWDEAPRYLLHDRDDAFDSLRATATAMVIDDVLTAPRAPWQNPFVERFIGSARRDCFDHVMVFNEASLLRLMGRYCSSTNGPALTWRWTRTRPFLVLSCRLATAPSSRSQRSEVSTIGTNAARPERLAPRRV